MRACLYTLCTVVFIKPRSYIMPLLKNYATTGPLDPEEMFVALLKMPLAFRPIEMSSLLSKCELQKIKT